jgi:hypothetical protein
LEQKRTEEYYQEGINELADALLILKDMRNNLENAEVKENDN